MSDPTGASDPERPEEPDKHPPVPVDPVERKRAYQRAWRRNNADRVRESRREWARNNPERARELKRETSRRAAERERARQERNAKRREFYAANAERLRLEASQYRARKHAEDPAGFQEVNRAHKRAWYERNRDKMRALQAEERAQDPASRREYARDYYRQHAEHITARRREAYRKNKERITERQKVYKATEVRRRKAGLPPRDPHRTPRAERQANARAADAFFSRTLTPGERTRVLRELGTPDHLMAAMTRDHARARAAHYLATMPPPPSGPPAPTAEAVELARMDEIGRRVNEMLRTQRPPQQPVRPDPFAPHQLPSAPPSGLSR